jgi:hypothetical protein
MITIRHVKRLPELHVCTYRDGTDKGKGMTDKGKGVLRETLSSSRDFRFRHEIL